MSNVFAYFPFIGASTQPSEKDMQEFLEVNNMTQGKLAETNGSADEPQIKLHLQVGRASDNKTHSYW